MGWIVTLFELIRDKVECWQFNRLKKSLEDLQLTVPLEVQVVKAEIRGINAEVKVYDLQAGNEKVRARIVKAQIRASKAR